MMYGSILTSQRVEPSQTPSISTVHLQQTPIFRKKGGQSPTCPPRPGGFRSLGLGSFIRVMPDVRPKAISSNRSLACRAGTPCLATLKLGACGLQANSNGSDRVMIGALPLVQCVEQVSKAGYL